MGFRRQHWSRTGHRFAVGLEAEIHEGGESQSCTAHDLSRSGVLLAGDICPPRSDVIELSIVAPAGDLRARVQGHPTRVEPDPSGQGLRVAIAFGRLDREQTDRIQALIHRVVERQSLAPLQELSPSASPTEIRAALENVPLALRISLGARANPRERELLLHDTHPQVLEALARNPHLSPPEIQHLSELRPLLPTTLERIARDPRWARNEDVRVALLTHPRAPLPLAEQLLEDLPLPALRRALQRPTLTDLMRSRILRRISKGARGAR